jgi:hypothetical protein
VGLHRAPGDRERKGATGKRGKNGDLPIRRPSRIELLLKTPTDNGIGVGCQLAMLSQKSKAELLRVKSPNRSSGRGCVWQASLIRRGCQEILLEK